MTGIDALLASLPSWTLVAGKGGVGKTTCAAALAVRSARSGVRTLILSTDPAGTLAATLGTPLGDAPRAVPGVSSLSACQLDAAVARNAFLAQWGAVLTTIIDRGTYLDRSDVKGLVDATLPGIDETMALLALADLADQTDWERVILDTAPTGHTLRLLALPDTFHALISLLDTMQGKHRFVVSALMHRYRPDEADAFISGLRERVNRLQRVLADATRTGVVLVARDDAVVVAETVRFASALSAMALRVSAIVVNALPPDHAAGDVVAAVTAGAPSAVGYAVPRLPELGTGIAAVDRWGASVRRTVTRRGSPRPTTKPRDGNGRSVSELPSAASDLAALPSVVVVGGKGGVGKTSVACALALARARAGHRTFLASTDPAPSVADALDQPIDDTDTVVADGFGLFARQIDAGASFARWRGEYESRVDAAFDALLGPGLDAAHDRAVARQLFALAPPGIDELYALIWLGDTLSDGPYDRIVIDPAPTGHLIRLLEMPALALDWTHRLLRLMLKYRELSGGGTLATELMAFARRTRAVGELLSDAERAGVLIVSLDEPIVRSEADRLLERVRGLGNHVPGIVWNRVTEVPRPLPAARSVRQFVAAAVNPPPVGTRALLRWYDDWRLLTLDG